MMSFAFLRQVFIVVPRIMMFQAMDMAAFGSIVLSHMSLA